MEHVESPMLLAESVAFVANRLSLDFVNTACRRYAEPLDLFGDVRALNTWLQFAEKTHGRRLDPDGAPWSAEEGEQSLARAVELRTALWEMVNAILESREPAPSAVEVLNAFLRSGPVFPRVSVSGGEFRYSLHLPSGQDPWLLEIARDAADLFCQSELTLLGQCEGATCVRVFYDTTKNHARRWCVEKCGSKVKAANYYRRKREALKAKDA